MAFHSKRKSTALVTILLLATGSTVNAGPRLTVAPEQGVFDEPFEVRVEGAPSNVQVSVRVSRTASDGTVWVTSGVFQSDAAGNVDTTQMPSISGSYRGVSPHGLLCSALPEGAGGFEAYTEQLTTNPRLPRYFPAPLEPHPIRVEASVNNEIIATTTVSRGFAVGVSGEEIATPEGVRGVYFAPAPGKQLGSPVMILNGSGGRVRRSDAARLASHGHPAFAFAIYNYADLPTELENYPIERVAEGARWLAMRAGTQHVAVMGVSRGSEAAAHAAIAFPDLFSGVVLSVPSHLADAGALALDAEEGDGAWTLGGQPFPVTDLGFWVDDPRIAEQAAALPGYNASAMVLGMWGSGEFEEKYGIAFEQIEAPILVIAGQEDHIWPSWVSAERIRQRLDRAGKADQVDVRAYTGAGHAIITPGFGGPLSTFAYNPAVAGFFDFGGTPNGNCDGAFDSSQAILEFLSMID